MQRTKIEYLTHSWSPIAMRCTPVSEGCKNCWHLAMAKRLAKNPMIDEDRRHAYMGGTSLLIQEELEAPLHLRKPGRIGVQFMGDLFHEDVDGGWLRDIFSVIRACQDHIFLILTKRPQNVNKKYFEYFGNTAYAHLWLGVSVENQKTADERIPILLQIPAAKRFVSVEPMLEEIWIDNYFPKLLCDGCGKEMNGMPGQIHEILYNIEDRFPEKCGIKFVSSGLDWVVCGGETGPGARPIELEWARSIVNQCRISGVPVFVKQLFINRKISKKMEEWPKDLRVREVPG